MCDHDNIRLDSNDVPRPANVGIDDPFTDQRILDIRLINGAENSSFKRIRLGVVEFLEISDCLLLLVLEVCKRLEGQRKQHRRGSLGCQEYFIGRTTYLQVMA